MTANDDKNRLASWLLLLVFAFYGGTYFFCRGQGSIRTRRAAVAPRGETLSPASELRMNGRCFFAGKPLLFKVFFPALWLESHLIPKGDSHDKFGQ